MPSKNQFLNNYFWLGKAPLGAFKNEIYWKNLCGQDQAECLIGKTCTANNGYILYVFGGKGIYLV